MGNRRLNSGVLLAIPAMLALTLFSSSCWTHKAPVAFTPPPPRAQPLPEAVPVLADPPMIASAVDLADSLGEGEILPGVIPNGVPEAPAPAVPKPAPRRNPVAVNPPKPAPAPPTDPPPAPRIGQLLSPDQVREYNRTIEESLERVKRMIVSLQKKNLTTDQTEILNRVRFFERQAEQLREQDLVEAVSLARRADVLAKDLMDRVR